MPNGSHKTMPWLAALTAAFLLFQPISRADGAPTAETAASVSASQLSEWVTQLDDDRYEARQHAQQNLEQLGQPALDAVVEAASSGSLERVTRAVSILLKWSEDENQGLRLEVLERIANLPNRPREAAMASRLLADAREQAALETLTKLGAQYGRDGHVHGLDNLQVLIGPNWQGGTEGLKHLQDVHHATTVSLVATPLEDSALAELSKLPSVQRIEIYSTAISRDSAKKFDKEHPNIQVDIRTALLGVRGMQHGTNISEVEPNSAADKAGIKRGDRITEFDGEPVANFEELTEKIRDRNPGDTAKLTIIRNEKSREVKVTFSDWSDSQMNVLSGRYQLQLTPNQKRNLQQNRQLPAWQVPAVLPVEKATPTVKPKREVKPAK